MSLAGVAVAQSVERSVSRPLVEGATLTMRVLIPGTELEKSQPRHLWARAGIRARYGKTVSRTPTGHHLGYYFIVTCGSTDERDRLMSGTLSVKQPHHDQQVADVKAVGGRVETCRSVRTKIRVLFPRRKLFQPTLKAISLKQRTRN